jgi:uncharacterized protein (UPF0333 family)
MKKERKNEDISLIFLILILLSVISVILLGFYLTKNPPSKDATFFKKVRIGHR